MSALDDGLMSLFSQLPGRFSECRDAGLPLRTRYHRILTDVTAYPTGVIWFDCSSKDVQALHAMRVLLRMNPKENHFPLQPLTSSHEFSAGRLFGTRSGGV
jgi:hypothetical protein